MDDLQTTEYPLADDSTEFEDWFARTFEADITDEARAQVDYIYSVKTWDDAHRVIRRAMCRGALLMEEYQDNETK